MFYLKQLPLFKVFFFLSLGFVLADYYSSFLDKYLFIILPTISILVISIIITLIFKKSLIFNIASVLILAFLGILSHSLYNEENAKNHFSKHLKNNYLKCEGNIKKISKTKSGVKIITSVNMLFTEFDSIEVTGNLLVYVKLNIDSVDINIGDKLKFSNYISKIPNARNPLTFNSRKYYHYQNIHFQTFLKKEKLIHIKNNQKHNLLKYFSTSKNKIKSKVKTLIHDKTHANIIISILLGDKQDLDKEILATFASTGTRHILTVSGMHVGIVALILNFLFSFYKSNNKIYTLIKTISVLSGIWYYAFLTGAGPAIMRASFMISLIIIGINLKKYINIFNLLFASAVILLLINPFQLFQISFILSYTAMLSILLFFKPINELFHFKKSKLVKYLWQLISLSIAAQILIFPLSLYYFHNAPLLFFLTAIISTPMAFATISFGFLMVITNSISVNIAEMIAYILDYIIKYSLLIIRYIESISFNIGDYIYLETIDIIIIFTSIALITIYLKTKSRFYLYAIIITIIAIFINQYIRISNSKYTNQIVIYSSKNRLIDIFMNGRCYNISNNNIDEKNLIFTTKNYRIYRNVFKITKIDSTDIFPNIYLKNNILNLPNNTIVFLKSHKDLIPMGTDIINILVISENLKFDLKPILKKYKISQIVLEKGMKYKIRKHWVKIAKENNIELWDINENGAFIKNLN